MVASGFALHIGLQLPPLPQDFKRSAIEKIKGKTTSMTTKGWLGGVDQEPGGHKGRPYDYIYAQNSIFARPAPSVLGFGQSSDRRIRFTVVLVAFASWLGVWPGSTFGYMNGLDWRKALRCRRSRLFRLAAALPLGQRCSAPPTGRVR